MPKIKLIIEYDGSNYHGFQYQENAITVQERLEDSIHALTGERVKLICAGRTDAGVHALGQVVTFDSQASIPASRWEMALNSFLPDEIRVLDSAQVADDFNPRFHAVRKKYKYLIYRKKHGAVFYRNYALHNREKLDIQSMQKACGYFLGHHNFRAFCARGSSNKTFNRIVDQCILLERESFWEFHIAANGFLYNMVRIIMGTILEVGRGKYQPEHIMNIIASQSRVEAGPTVPPQGLYLCWVEYPEQNLYTDQPESSLK